MRAIHLAVLMLAGAALAGVLPVTFAMAQEQETQAAPPAFAPQNGGRGGRGGGGRGRGGPPLTPEQVTELKARFIAPASAPDPAGNVSTPAKVALGTRLFFDPGLSANGKVACATCHDARKAFTDGEALSLGVKGERLARRTQTVINLAWLDAFFWDGRATTLEQQAVMPIAEPAEMGMPHAVMVTNLKADAEYRKLFAAAFPGESASVETVGKAIAAFERTLLYANAPFDRWIAGDENAISDAAKRGFVEFNTRAGCVQCHSGWNFSDGKFHDIGLRSSDAGRFGVAQDESQRNLFKTPGLRNIAERAPYMHDGQLGSLNQVLRHYRRFERRATLSPEMRNVRTGRANDIVAFLETLTSPTPPELVRLQETLEKQVRAAPP
jgi:cytochrome c peroxidase